MLVLSNLIIGSLPDAVGLLAFGLAMVAASALVRKVIGEDGAKQGREYALEERVREN